ncbi:helix-turn-helix domain-containing protein [Roseibium album]|uniref:helix-turn-helix domain-containing protein n=1 Tax=Roseibium album TaxID=311410 RepID=UPI003BAE2B38
MAFGQAFGQLIRSKRGIEGLTQQALAVTAFGDERFKTRISELENGKVGKPQTRTIDALVVALNISNEELNAILNEEPHPRVIDNLCDFFDADGTGFVDIEVATNTSGKAVLFHNRLLKVEIKRAEYFLEEAMFVCLEEGGRRRPAGLPLSPEVTENLMKCSEILFVHLEDGTQKATAGKTYPLKIVP